jgi:hypothetical protein
MKRKKLALVAVSLALCFGTAAGAARSGLLGALAIGGKGHPAASGIQVQGKWMLVVRNKHGKVVARRRFENALTADGKTMLVALLLGGTNYGFEYNKIGSQMAGAGVVGGQAVQLDDGTSLNSFQGCHVFGPVLPSPCFVSHMNGDTSAVGQLAGSGPLHIAVSGGVLTLSGSAPLPVATTISKVETLLKTCSSHNDGLSIQEYDPHACAIEDSERYAWYTFTSKTLATPLPVQAGQSVAFTVKLSFS